MAFKHLHSIVTIATTQKKCTMLYVNAVSLYMPSFMNILSIITALEWVKSSLEAKSNKINDPGNINPWLPWQPFSPISSFVWEVDWEHLSCPYNEIFIKISHRRLIFLTLWTRFVASSDFKSKLVAMETKNTSRYQCSWWQGGDPRATSSD